MIKNIIFDVGMVLVDFNWEAVLMGLGIQGEVFERVAAATVGSKMWNEYDRSRLSDDEILAGFISNAPDCEKEIRLLWEHIGDTIHRYPYTDEWIQGLKHKGYHCYILSNYPKRSYELTKEALAFESLMDGVLFSYEVQQIKPEPEIFKTLLERFGLVPKECVFLDDNPQNVAAARALGIHALQFTSHAEAVKALEDLGVK